MTVQPNPESSAGLRTLQPGKSALRLSTWLLLRGEMPTNPNACQSKQQCRCHQLGQDHTVLRFWGRKSTLNSSSVNEGHSEILADGTAPKPSLAWGEMVQGLHPDPNAALAVSLSQ